MQLATNLGREESAEAPKAFLRGSVGMNLATKDYIDGLKANSIPWNRMFTAYGTADRYPQLLSEMEQASDIDQWKRAFFEISDFEHQGTLFPPAPFVFVFLCRLLRKLLEEGSREDIVEWMLDQFAYYVDICIDAESSEHAHQLERLSDLLEDRNLLPKECTFEALQDFFEDPDAVSDTLFYSLYFYSLVVLSQIPDTLDQYEVFSRESKELRSKMASIADLSETV